jgi:hypothetical protein
LLGKHEADELVRPGHLAERQRDVGSRKQRLSVTVGAADSENNLGDTVISPFRKLTSEGAAIDGSPAFVQRHEFRKVGSHRQQTDCLLVLAHRLRFGAAFANFANRKRKPSIAARRDRPG